MAAIDHVVIHAGTQKTGSSLIQTVLRQMPEILKKEGVVFVDRKDFMATEYRAWGAYDRKGYSKERFNTQMARRIEARIKEIRRPRMMLISNESISGSVRPEYGNPLWHRAGAAVSELMSLVRPRRTTVILYVRRQDRLLESMYMQRVHEGKTTEWDKFRKATCLDTRADYNVLLDSIESVAGIDAVKVQPFEVIGAGGRAFVENFFDMAGLGSLAGEIEDIAPINPSYTQKAWEAALTVNPTLDSIREVRKVRRLLREMFPSGQYPKAALLTDDQRGEMLERYREVNERFFATYLPDYPSDSYSSAEGTKALAGTLLAEGANH